MRLAVRWFSIVVLVVVPSNFSSAVQRTWIGGNVDWVDGAGNNANWTGSDEPDLDDEAIFNTPNSVNLGSSNTVIGLTMSGGIDLHTNGFQLSVDGLVQLSDASTNLFIGNGLDSVNADDVAINSGATIELSGGTLVLDEEVGSALLDINAGGDLQGHGTITLNDSPAVPTALLINDGTLTALSRGVTIFSPPPTGTLQINDAGLFGRVDLDGTGEAGVVNVNRNQTLDLNTPLADGFNGTLNLIHNATFDSSSAWTLAGGNVFADNGFVAGGLGFSDIPAATSFIAGGTLTQSGGAITVVDTDGTLQFDAPFTMNGGTLTNNGHVIFNNSTTINNAAIFTMGASGSDLTVGQNAQVTIDQASFNLDGNAATTVITVNQGGNLTLTLGDYDNDAVTNGFDGVVTLNGGDIDVTTSDAFFVMDGTLNFQTSLGDNAVWDGEPIHIGNDTGTLDANINVTGSGSAAFATNSGLTFNSDADVNIPAGSLLAFLSGTPVTFNTVNGANNAEFTGAGEIEFTGNVFVNEALTFNMPGGSVDFDSADATGATINIDAPFVINTASVQSVGNNNVIGGPDTLDVNNSVGTGALTVNLDDPAAEWTLNGPGVMNLVNGNVAATLLAGSGVNVNGTINVTGDVRITARLDIAGVVNVDTAAQPLRLGGGPLGPNVNRLLGGTINGPGLLGADSGFGLSGFGTINAGVDFDGTSNLMADDGTLVVNGTVIDVGTIGTADIDGVLQMTNPWNTIVASQVGLQGGTLQGGTITNDNGNGIQGFGTVTSRVVNNSGLLAGGSGTLLFQTAANDNDWDGAGTGVLRSQGGILELRDNAPFGFTGTVIVIPGGRVFTNGFALDFNPGSAINLTSGTYESTSSTDIGGTVTIGAGSASTIKVTNNFLLTFENGSSTTLNGNLQLQNNNIIVKSGATFSGTGALVVDVPSSLSIDNGASVNALLVNNGVVQVGGGASIGTATVKDFSQGTNGSLAIELFGTLPNQFDRLQATGVAQLDGRLGVGLAFGFNPAVGTTFDILSTVFGVSGRFSLIDYVNLPADKTFHVDYLANAVRLTVVNKPIFSADFDDDGDVDNTDYNIWRGAFHLNQLGDANGDNITDASDYVLWRKQFGSVPGAGSSLDANAAVPEPTVSAIVAMAILCTVAQRRRAV